MCHPGHITCCLRHGTSCNDYLKGVNDGFPDRSRGGTCRPKRRRCSAKPLRPRGGERRLRHQFLAPDRHRRIRPVRAHRLLESLARGRALRRHRPRLGGAGPGRAEEPVPQAAPAPTPIAAEPPRPVIEKVTLSSDVLFEFNKATLRPEGQQKLDELAGRISDANIDEIVAIGHADRIASENYNQKLSEDRAKAVKAYLVDKGMREQLVKAEGKGESQPVTDCRKMGPERGNNKKLVECLQPDRRVEIEVFGTRETAATGGTGSGAGTTGSASGR